MLHRMDMLLIAPGVLYMLALGYVIWRWADLSVRLSLRAYLWYYWRREGRAGERRDG